jgi:Phage tail protein
MVSSLSPYQFAFNDFVFGAGTVYSVIDVDGIASLPPLRVQDDNRGYVDGSYSGRDFYDGRTITFTIVTFGDSSHTAQYYYRALKTALVPQQIGTPGNLSTFQFRLDSGDGLKTMQGRVRANETVIDADYTYGYIQSLVTLYFPDPRYYDNTVQTGSGTTVSVANAGWATTCPTITISSPSASGLIYNGTTTMSFANVNTGQNLVIDLLYRTISQNSSSARNVLVGSSKWLEVPANTTQSIISTLGSMSISWQNAYI